MGDQRKDGGRTRELDREDLARLVKEAAGEVVPPTDLASGTEPPQPPLARTATLDDPMTMALLAEVARDARTIDLDPDAIARAAAEPAPPATPTDTPHPHVKRRGER